MKKLALSFLAFLGTFFAASLAFAAEGGVDAATASANTTLIGIGAGLGVAIAAFGGALGQGKAAAAALEGIGRNPQAAGKIQTPMILGMALIESLVILAFAIAYLLQGKIPAIAA